MKIFKFLLLSFVCIALIIYLFNYFFLQQVVNKELANDNRNSTISISVHYQYYVNPNVLIFDIKDVNGFSKIDIFRCFLQTAYALKEARFGKVELSSKGKTKFYVTCEYFNKTGKEYETQNSIYTLRTFPENLFNNDGRQAYQSAGGGFISAMTDEMNNVNDAFDKWLKDN